MRIHNIPGVEGDEPETPVKYHVLKDKGISVLFNVCTKDKTVSLDFAKSLAVTTKTMFDLGVPFVMLDANNSNFTDLTRNKAASVFVNSKCTHLLQVDSDMSWNVNELLDMFLYDKEFICGVGRKKTDEVEYCALPLYNGDTVIGQLGKTEEDVLIKMKYVGGAFTLHKRSVFEKIIKHRPDIKSHGVGAREIISGFAFYQCVYDLIGHKMEDYFFCDLCTECGIDIWCYPNVNLGHQGIKDYQGNYLRDHRKAEPEPEEKIEDTLSLGVPDSLKLLIRNLEQNKSLKPA